MTERMGRTGQEFAERTRGYGEEVKQRVQESPTAQRIGEKARGVGEDISARTREMGAQLSQRMETMDQPGRAEDAAAKAGETVGRGIKRLGNILNELGRGFAKGSGMRQGPEAREREEQPRQMYRETRYEEREATPYGEQRKEVRRKEQM